MPTAGSSSPPHTADATASLHTLIEALRHRHLQELTFSEVRRALQALSSLYVQRRNKLTPHSAAGSTGKRAAFALFYGPLHFLLMQHITAALALGNRPLKHLFEIGCGTATPAAAWALSVNPKAIITGYDLNPWAVQEARWTLQTLKLTAHIHAKDITRLSMDRLAADHPHSAILAAFVINELNDAQREKYLAQLMAAKKHGAQILIVEPIAKTISPWWDQWADTFIKAGGRADAWRFRVTLPPFLRDMDKAAGLNHRELKAKSLYV